MCRLERKKGSHSLFNQFHLDLLHFPTVNPLSKDNYLSGLIFKEFLSDSIFLDPSAEFHIIFQIFFLITLNFLFLLLLFSLLTYLSHLAFAWFLVFFCFFFLMLKCRSALGCNPSITIFTFCALFLDYFI